MGWDITGMIECRELTTTPEATWIAARSLNDLYEGRNYDSFGCLFGWKNYANFRPIAEGRGLPSDVSSEVREDCERYDDEAGATWISWAEIKAIDWEEESEQADSRIHRYERNDQGELIYTRKATWDREFAELLEGQQEVTEAGMFLSAIEALVMQPVRAEGQQWEKGNVVYRAEKLKRKEVCSDWQNTFKVMQELAATYGDEGVRLIVWFYF